jgi:hypothetical protein
VGVDLQMHKAHSGFEEHRTRVVWRLPARRWLRQSQPIAAAKAAAQAARQAQVAGGASGASAHARHKWRLEAQGRIAHGAQGRVPDEGAARGRHEGGAAGAA